MGLMEATKQKFGILIAYFLIYVVWGSTYYFIGVALQDFPPFLLGGIRFITAGLLLLGLCLYRGEPVMRRQLIRRSAITGIILLFIDMAVVMLAQRYLSSSLVAIIAASTALWIMALDVPMWKTNFRSVLTIVGIVSGFLGVMVLYIEQLYTTQGVKEHGEYGVMLLLFGCLSWALGTLYAKYRSSGAEKTNAFAGSAWQMLFAGAAFWLCATITGEVSETDLSQVTASSWMSLAYLIVFGSLLAYSAYVWLLKVRPATEVATHAYVNPFIAVLIGVGLGGEQITVIQLLGLVIILISVMLISRKKKKTIS